jgi:phage tail-like protein
MDTSVLKIISGEIVDFFNTVQTPAQLSSAIVDDPNYGKPLPDGINLSLARRIINERDSTFRGSFKSLEDIDKIKGVGPSTWHNILVSFLLKKMEVLMPNRRAHDHIGAFNFKVEIEGVTVGAFFEVRNVESLTEVIEYQDGEDIIMRKRPGRTSYPNIVLRRGFINTDELWNWRKAVIDGKVERKSGSIILCGDDASEIMRFNFFEGWPCRYSLSSLNGETDRTLFEEIEIAVEKIERG